MDKTEILTFMRQNDNCHLATVEDGAPRVRGMRLYKADENGIIIQTAKNKDLYKQLCKNPQAELCFNNFKDGVQLRVSGIFQTLNDIELLKQVEEDRPFLKTLIPKGYEVALFRLTNAIAHVWTMKTNLEPKMYIEL